MRLLNHALDSVKFLLEIDSAAFALMSKQFINQLSHFAGPSLSTILAQFSTNEVYRLFGFRGCVLVDGGF